MIVETTTETPAVLRTASHLPDFKGVYEALRRQSLLDDLKRLQRPSPWHSTLALVFDWALIFAGWALVWYVSWWLIPIALVVIGVRQRALGNLLHESGHRMLLPGWRLNDRVGTGLIALPFLTLLPYYREMHSSHHAFLGSSKDDELIHADEDRELSAWQLFWKHALNSAMFKSNVLAAWPSMTAPERALALGWWAGFLAVFSVLFGVPAAALFVALWFGAKMTVFHAVTTFREISDHVGLEPGTIIGFTRNSPHGTLLSFLIHPHQNNYHLTHHLAPQVPFPKLKKAHAIFCNVPEYAAAHHCDGYFTGKQSVIVCWVGKCWKLHRSVLFGRSPG